MIKNDSKSPDARWFSPSNCIREVLIYLTLVPGVLYGFLSLGNLPVL